MLFVVIVFLGLDYQYRDALIIDVVDDAIVRSDVSRIGHVVASDECLGMPQASAGMLHDVHQNLRSLLEEVRVRLLPLAQRPVSLLGVINRVGHRLSK